MTGPTSLYRPSLGLLTDLYQLTMAYGYHKSGVGDHQATFHLNFRQNPFAGGYTLTAGLAYVIDWLAHFGFDRTDLEYLAGLEGNDGRPLFDAAFLEYLKAMRFTCDVRAMPEGTPAFPYEPLLRVTGPIIQAQLLETPLLNMINFQSLIATKAARVCQSTGGDPVLEFGLRRAQGIDGALAASRAAFIGGCAATSNVLAGRLFGIPVRGTHAHSWVMCFDSEPDAFEAYARALPNNCVFLVDTYDTLQGVRRAIAAGQKLREQGHKLVGIRLDSGDLAYLSGQARKMLDQAGFTGAVILASNDLDEHIIASLKQQGACIGLWGVGTKLVTGHDQPAIGGVYKMSAIRRPGGPWQNKIKLSEQVLKVSNPGIQQVRRYRDGNRFVGDAIYDERRGLIDGCTIVDPLDMTRRKTLETGLAHDDLLVPIFDRGRCVYDPPSLPSIRQRVGEQLACLDETVKRFVHPHQYPAGLEESLFNSKTDLIMSARRENM
ncbi:MAG: nicotinate phosphoribosyltransferase [Phycisphaerae bacterium]